MNKESIYKIIGYNGEYNATIKKAIRKLLKENHPDNNGDRRIFELINEVKGELENNKVSFDYKNNTSSIKDNEDIDYLYCAKMIDIITKEKNIYTKNLNKKKEELSNCVSKYKEYYRKSIDLESNLLFATQYMDKLKNIKKASIILLALASIVFIISVLEKSILFFALFTIIAIVCVLTIHKSFFIMNKMTESNKNRVKKYVKANTGLRDNQQEQEELKKEINELSKKINNYENDLRFYSNLIKNRG